MEAGSPPRPTTTDDDARDPGTDAVESALVAALTAASRAGRFDVVGQLARELEARRRARAGNVVQLRAETISRGSR